jgi:hypothetical protein
MISLVAPEELSRKAGKSEGVFQVDYIGNSHKNQRGPQAFLVELEKPGHIIKPHFHHVDQFQIVVDGGGTLGKHELHPVTVHYTDSFTPYGPIVAGENGLKFFNFRPAADVGAEYMPGSRERLLRHAGRALNRLWGCVRCHGCVDHAVDRATRRRPRGHRYRRGSWRGLSGRRGRRRRAV